MNYRVKLNKRMEGHKIYAVGRNNARARGTTIETLHSIEVVSVARVNAKIKFLSTGQTKTLTVDGRGAHNFDYTFYRSEDEFKAEHYLCKIIDALRYPSSDIPPTVIIKLGEILGVDMTDSHNVVVEPGVGV